MLNYETPEEIVRKRSSDSDDFGNSIEDNGDVEFGDIRGVGLKRQKSEDVGKPGSKVRRLKRMLQEAEKKKQRIEELKQQGTDGVKRAHAEQWNDVVKEVSGEKSFRDTSKLKKALKRIEKTKSKSAGEWKVV
jgi:Surfeit locus protein 6